MFTDRKTRCRLYFLNRDWWEGVWGRRNLPQKSSTVLSEPKFGLLLPPPPPSPNQTFLNTPLIITNCDRHSCFILKCERVYQNLRRQVLQSAMIITHCDSTHWLPYLKFINHTAISRKVVGKNVHATIMNGNMGYDQ